MTSIKLNRGMFLNDSWCEDSRNGDDTMEGEIEMNNMVGADEVKNLNRKIIITEDNFRKKD